MRERDGHIDQLYLYRIEEAADDVPARMRVVSSESARIIKQSIMSEVSLLPESSD